MQLRLILNIVGFSLILPPALTGCQSPPSTGNATAACGSHSLGAHSQAQHEAQAVDPSRCGVLVMAHGGSAQWNEDVERAVEPLRERYPIEIAYGMAQTSTLRAATERLEQQGVNQIAVVRMFISAESFLGDTEYILGLRESTPDAGHHGNHGAHQPAPAAHHPPTAVAPHEPAEAEQSGGGHVMEPPTPIETESTFHLSRTGVAESPLVDEILVDRVRSLSVNPAGECILILAHGPGDDGENERWLADMRRRTEQLRDIAPFVDVRCETLREDWPDRRAEAEARIRNYVETHSDGGARVIVIPFRVAGFGPYTRVLEGLNYVADGRGFCPHPNMTEWIDSTARVCLPPLADVRMDGRSSARAD